MKPPPRPVREPRKPAQNAAAAMVALNARVFKLEVSECTLTWSPDVHTRGTHGSGARHRGRHHRRAPGRSAWPARSPPSGRESDPLVVDAGAIVNSIVHYPIGMSFFTTPDLLEIGGHPLACAGQKPTREEALKYYRGVVRAEGAARPDVHQAGDRRPARARRFAATCRAAAAVTLSAAGASSSPPATTTTPTCSTCPARIFRTSATASTRPTARSASTWS